MPTMPRSRRQMSIYLRSYRFIKHEIQKFKKPYMHLLGFAQYNIKIIQSSIYEKNKACFP